MTSNPVLTIIANGTLSVTPTSRGQHLIVIGSNADDDLDFDSASIIVNQQGIVLKDEAGDPITAIVAAERFIVDGVLDGEPINFVTTSVASASDIDISIYKLEPATVAVAAV